MELKKIDVSGQNSLFTAAGTLTLLNGVAVGTDYTDRIGRKIILKSHLFRMNVRLAGLTAGIGEFIRVMLIYDCQTNGAAPVVADILSTSTVISPINLNNRDRFKVLKDWMIGLEAANFAAAVVTAGSPQHHFRQMYKKINMEQIFGGTGATVGSIQTGSIYLLTMGLIGNIAAIDYDSRLRFIDG